jgi:hypothetical protein
MADSVWEMNGGRKMCPLDDDQEVGKIEEEEEEEGGFISVADQKAIIRTDRRSS